MTTSIRIQKGIPCPEIKQRGMGGTSKEKYPWSKMEIGDSFQFTAHYQRGAYTAATNASRLHLPKKFVARPYEGGMRVWRIV